MSRKNPRSYESLREKHYFQLLGTLMLVKHKHHKILLLSKGGLHHTTKTKSQ